MSDTYTDVYSDVYSGTPGPGPGPGPSSARPTLTVDLGLDAPVLQAMASVVWTPVAEVDAASWDWGRQHELNRFDPGRCRIPIDDRDRKFDPANTSSPYNGKLTPLRRIRLQATWAGVPYDLWFGYVLTWPRSWQYQRDATVTIEAVDALGVLNLWNVWGSPFEQVVRADDPTAWLRLGDASGVNAGDTTGNGFGGALEGAPTTGQDPLVSGDSMSSIFFGRNGTPALQQRISVPRRDLIDRFPFTIETMFSVAQERTGLKAILTGIGGPMLPITEQFVLEVVDTSTNALDAGKMALFLEAAGVGRTITSGQFVDGGTRHHVVAQMDSVSAGRVFIDGVDTSVVSGSALPRFPQIQNSWTIGNSPPVPAAGDYGLNGYQQDVIVYNGVTLSPSRVAAHAAAALTGWDGDLTGARIGRVLDELGWPAGDRAIDAGKSTIGPTLQRGGALAYLQALDTTEYGAFFADHRNGGKLTFHDRHKVLTQSLYTTSQFTFSDVDGTATVAYEPPALWGTDHADIRNLATVRREGGSVQTAKDATSVAAYGQRELAVTVLHSSDAQAKDLAKWLVSQYAQPVTRVRQVRCMPELNAAADWPKILGAQMRQRVTFTAQPPGGATFTQDSHVERIAHEVTKDAWVVMFDLSAADTQSYWILGTSALGSGTRLGF